MENKIIDKNIIGFSQLKKWLRHKHPMIYLDRVLDYQPALYLEALLNISGNMDCIAGHFPEYAIFPATNLLQAFSQAAIILLQLSTRSIDADEITVVGSLNSRFFKLITPGDTVILNLTVDKIYNDTLYFSGKALVNNNRVACIKSSISRVNINSIETKLW